MNPMTYKKFIAVTFALTVCALTDSNVMAHGGAGSGHGGGFGGGSFGRGGGFAGGSFQAAAPSVEAALTVAALALALAIADFVVAFAAIGSTIDASTIGSSSLVILGTRFFTIRMTIILITTDMTRPINLFTKAMRDIPTL